ncbi:RNA polymerase sigma-70 factor, partial [Bacteroides salyersiae]
VQEHISTSLKIIRAYFTKHNGAYTDLLLLLFILNS